MPLLFIRSRVPFQPGANSTDVVINDIHFNLTALDYYNYTLYSNGTLSNGSECYLAFKQYQPLMFSNGSFVNVTSCYTPILNMDRRGSVGLAFALLFAMTVLLTVTNLRKHGRRYLPLDKRWSLVGRRWKWYWLLLVAVCGTVSCFMSIDVDRYYLQGAPIILQSFFYTLLMPILMATVWEAVRHWGSWQERQICDRDPLAFTEPSNANTRETQELFLPLVFYLFACLNFFLTIPRSWTPIELQRSPEQQNNVARPTATDGRFKAAGIVALVGTMVIWYSLEHSIYRYIPHPTDRRYKSAVYIAAAPSQFVVAIVLLLIKIIYAIASSFIWSISPFKADVNPGWLYGLGYTPALLIILLFNICGFCEINEDKQLLITRGEHIPRKYKFKRKRPAWLPSGRFASIFSRDIGGGRPTSENFDRYVEMGVLKPPLLLDEGKDGVAAQVTSHSRSASDHVVSFADSGTADSIDYIEQVVEGIRAPETRGDAGNPLSRTQSSESTTLGDEPPQVVTSILDV